LPRSFDSVFYGAAGTDAGGASDDEFNRVSFLSHFEGSNNGVNNAFEDGSGQSRSLSNYGNPAQGSFGPFARPDGEWGVSFDGDDYLTIAYSSDFNFGTGSFTVEAFVFLRDLSGIQGIYSTNTGANPVPKIVMYLDGATPKLHINALNGSGNLSLNSTTDITVGTWNHIAFVRNSSTWYWFINGTQAGTGSNSTNITFSNVATTIGYGGEGYFTAMNGFISNFRVVNGTALYTSNFTAPTAPLTAVTNTKLLTCQSNRFVDNSASAHTLTPTGNPAVTAFGPFLTSSVYSAGTNGASSQLGATNSVEIATGTWAQLGTGDFTWEYWIYPIAVNNYHLGSGTSGQNLSSTFTLGMSNKQLILYYTADGTAAHLLATSGTPEYNLNEWHHLAYVRAGNVHKIYANGILATSETRSGAMANSTGPTVIGQFGTGGVYGYGAEGIYCDVRLVKGTAVYSGSTYTVPTAPLTAISNTELLLNFKNGQAIDSAAQNNLTLQGQAKLSTAQAKFGDSSFVLRGTNTGDYGKCIIEPFGTGNFTVECFVRINDKSDNQGFFQIADGWVNSAVKGPALEIRSGRWRWFYGNGGNAWHGSAGPAANDTWYHVAFVRNGTTSTFYADGTAVLTASDSTDYTWGHLAIGVNYDGNYYFGGYIDDFRISRMARYTSNFTPATEPFADKGR